MALAASLLITAGCQSGGGSSMLGGSASSIESACVDKAAETGMPRDSIAVGMTIDGPEGKETYLSANNASWTCKTDRSGNVVALESGS